MKRVAVFFVILIGLICNRTEAQDIHSSLYYYNLNYYCPSTLPAYNDLVWFNFSHRQQWNSFLKPYTTSSTSLGLMPASTNLFIQVGYVNDLSMDGMYKRDYLPFSIGYFFKISKNSYLSSSLGANYRWNRVNYSGLNFGDQWTNYAAQGPGFWNPTNELFDIEGKTSLDIIPSFTLITENKRNQVRGLINLNGYHYSTKRNLISEGSINDSWKSYYTWRASIFGMMDIVLPKGRIFRTRAFYYLMNNNNLLLLQSNIYMGNFSLGIGTRSFNRDYFVNLGYTLFSNFRAEFNYEMNVSKLIPSSNMNGAFEVSLVYEVPRGKGQKSGCPAFPVNGYN
jgi:hypothetical protein